MLRNDVGEYKLHFSGFHLCHLKQDDVQKFNDMLIII
jgi:hypothetical protein